MGRRLRTSSLMPPIWGGDELGGLLTLLEVRIAQFPGDGDDHHGCPWVTARFWTRGFQFGRFWRADWQVALAEWRWVTGWTTNNGRSARIDPAFDIHRGAPTVPIRSGVGATVRCTSRSGGYCLPQDRGSPWVTTRCVTLPSIQTLPNLHPLAQIPVFGPPSFGLGAPLRGHGRGDRRG